jgi:hypothetical protein
MMNMNETPNPRQPWDDLTAEDAIEMFGFAVTSELDSAWEDVYWTFPEMTSDFRWFASVENLEVPF